MVSPPSWSHTFPRLYELFLASSLKESSNWFHHRSTKNAIEDPPDPFLIELEKDLQELDAVTWKDFIAKTKPKLLAIDNWGWWTSLFECFNELKGYLYLKDEGYSHIRFIKEKIQMRTPDLCGQQDGGWAWLEVKTLHETHDENAYLMRKGKYAGQEKDARKVVHQITDSMKQRLTNKIEDARGQLELDHPELPQPVMRKIIFLLIWFDSYTATKQGIEELGQFLNEARPAGIEIVHRVMNTIII
jgi:hypothetical protein